MKKREKSQKSSRVKTIWIIIAIVLAAAVIGTGIYFFINKVSGNDTDTTDEISKTFTSDNQSADSSDAFGAYGITSIDTEDTTFDVDNMESALEIEEIYVSSGETVNEGDKILKFTDESVETVREELTKALREAELQYRAGVIEYEQSKITNEYTKELTEIEGKQADTVYNETLQSLEAEVNKAKESLDEINEEIAEYQSDIDDQTYLTACNEAQAQYDKDLEILTDKIDEWGVSWSEITGSGMRMVNFSDLHSQYVYVLSKYYSILEDDLDALETAENDYEDNGTDAVLSYNLTYLKYQLASYKESYEEAKKSYDTNVLEANLTKENSKSEAEKAEETYEANMDKAEADYNELKDAYEDAQEALDNFEALAGDGYFYAQESGSLLRISLRKGRTVTTDTVMYTMTNPDSMTVSVSVGEEYISRISVGDSVFVYSEDEGTFMGTISSISPVSSSSQSGSVTYSVTVSMTGDFSGLSTNETVSVYFGMGGES